MDRGPTEHGGNSLGQPSPSFVRRTVSGQRDGPSQGQSFRFNDGCEDFAELRAVILRASRLRTVFSMAVWRSVGITE